MILKKQPVLFTVFFAILSSIFLAVNQYQHTLAEERFYSISLYTLLPCLIGILLCIYLLYFAKQTIQKASCAFLDIFRLNEKSQALLPIAGAATILIAALLLLFSTLTAAKVPSAPSTMVSDLVLVCLSVLTGLAFFISTQAQLNLAISEKKAFYCIIPMFWACFDLMITYKANSANPVIYEYIYELLTAILIMYAFYHFAAFLFGTGRPRRFIVFSLLAIFFIINAVLPHIFVNLLLGDLTFFTSATFFRYISFIAAGLFLCGNVYIASKNLNSQV